LHVEKVDCTLNDGVVAVMRYCRFEEPVPIVVGLNFPTYVKGVTEAYAMLLEWPLNQRGPAHRMAMKACKAALDGDIDTETARSTFAAFAGKCGLLMPQTDVVAAVATGAMPGTATV
jgi:hypothetical protein